MSIVLINFDCGCGEHYKTVEAASAHVDATGHTLNVAGSVSPTERRVRVAKAPSTRTASVHTVRPQQFVPDADDKTVNFSNLRARLGRV